MRLFPKLLLSFLAVVLVGVAVVSFLANQATAREVRGLMSGSGMTTDLGLAQRLAGYYRGHGSWEGVESLLAIPGHGMMRQRLIVVDSQSRVVADTDGLLMGQTLDNVDSTATPLEVDGVSVGALIVEGGMMGGVGPPWLGSNDPTEGALLGRVTAAFWLAALAAGVAALVVGSGIAYSLVRPIRRLTAATAALARGDLSQRVPVTSGDEIGELASSFNAMAADLEHAERLRREMTADIAHELRNPLAVLQSNVEAVIDGVLPPTPETLAPLLDQTRLLSRIVDDLHTLSLAEAGQLSLHRAPTDPAVLARSVIARFTPPAEAKRITLQLDLPPNLPLLNIDAHRIEQVLGNLLSNAIRHTPEAGVIGIQLSVTSNQLPVISKQSLGDSKPLITDHCLLITVSDTGPGIPPDSLPYIFDRFYRADRSRSRAEGGTGLGLAIARQLVRLHGGEISVTSEPGKGTQVSFTLPC